MSSVPTALQDAATARKERLAALKKRKTLHDSNDTAATTDGAADPSGTRTGPKEVFKFRNYDPETGTARKHTKVDEQDTVEKQVEGLAEQVIALDELKRAQELDLTNIQPKRANWDLKRDLDRKLAKLKPKTDLAISTLIRQRLQAQKGGQAAGQGAAEMIAQVGQPGGPQDDSDVGSDEE